MKLETFERAQDLNNMINQLENAVRNVEDSNKKHCGERMINLGYLDEATFGEIQAIVVKNLKGRLTNAKKQFTALK